VPLVEDLTTDGGSKIKFCDAVRKAGAEVADTMVIFYYDIFPETRQTLASHGIRLHALATWWDVLDHAGQTGHFDAATLQEVERFLNAPLAWSGRNGGATEIAS
jgi:orotate phosphoribosyltransferase